MKFEKTFGDTVKKLREGNQYTLHQVAMELGIDTSMLGKIEKNNRKPTKQLIKRIAKFFDVSEKELTIAFLSDEVAYQVLSEEEVAQKILKVAEKKVKYMTDQKSTDK